MEDVIGKVAGVQQEQLECLIKRATANNQAKQDEPIDLSKSSNTKVPRSEKEWKDYHGFTAWRLEKVQKNPFDREAYLNEGEKVSTFEDLMKITFKTLAKCVEMKWDVRGLICHGRLMSEEASKHIFIDEAFISYDEGVRRRAGEAGPIAFGQVMQEEVFLHFCPENTINHSIPPKQ